MSSSRSMFRFFQVYVCRIVGIFCVSCLLCLGKPAETRCDDFHESSEIVQENPALVTDSEVPARFFSPTHFTNVKFPTLSAAEQEQLLKVTECIQDPAAEHQKAFAELQSFLIFQPNFCLIGGKNLVTERKYMASGQLRVWNNSEGQNCIFQNTVEEEVRNFLEALPPEILKEWRIYADASIERCLRLPENQIPADHFIKRMLREAPLSSYEAEFLEIRAQIAWQQENGVLASEFWKKELEFRTVSGQKAEGAELHFLKELPTVAVLQHRLETNAMVRPKVHENLIEKISLVGLGKQQENNQSETEQTAQWKVSMTHVFSPSGEVVFEDFTPEEHRGRFFLDGKRNIQEENKILPQFSTFSPNRDLLAARLGPLVTFWPEGEQESRPQAYLVLLDLSRGGQLLWTISPESFQWVFAGNPLADSEFVYLPVLKIDKKVLMVLNVYSIANGSLIKKIPLFTSDSPDKCSEQSVFFPLYWSEDGSILAGCPASGVQIRVFPQNL